MNSHIRFTRRYLQDVENYVYLRKEMGRTSADECLHYFSIPSQWAWYVGPAKGVG